MSLDMFSSQSYAKPAKVNEARRQGRIKQGLGEVNAIFGGGTIPQYTPITDKAMLHPGQNYYWMNRGGAIEPYLPTAKQQGGLGDQLLKDAGNQVFPGLGGWGKGFSFLPGLGGLLGDSGPNRSDYIRSAFKKGLLYTRGEDKTYQGFGPDFYNQRAQDYVNYAMPQLSQQYQDTQRAMQFGLANRSLLGSTEAGRQGSRLNRRFGEAQQEIADTGRGQANTLQQTIEQQRANLINQLYQSQNPQEQVRQALVTASGAQQPSTFAPIVNMFSNLANQYYTNQLLNNYRQPVGVPGQDVPGFGGGPQVPVTLRG